MGRLHNSYDYPARQELRPLGACHIDYQPMVVRTAIATAAMLPSRALHAIVRIHSFLAMRSLLACARDQPGP